MKLIEYIEKKSTATFKQIAERFKCSMTQAYRRFRQINVPYKKIESAFIERKEIGRQEYQKQIKEIPYEHRIYVDETGMYEHLYKTYDWAKKGAKIFAKIHGQKGKRMNVIGAIHNNKFTAHQEIVGSVNSGKFVEFISKAIVPHLKNGDFVIMDNAKIHDLSSSMRRCLVNEDRLYDVLAFLFEKYTD